MKNLDGHRLLAEKGLDHFKAASIFGALSDDAITFLLSRGQVCSLADGEELFQPGSAGDSFVVVLEGELELVQERDGVTTLLKVAQVGEQLGYVSMIGLFDRFGIGRGRGETIVLEVNSDLYYQFHLEFPFDFGILMLNLSRDMARTIYTIATTGTQAAIDGALA